MAFKIREAEANEEDLKQLLLFYNQLYDDMPSLNEDILNSWKVSISYAKNNKNQYIIFGCMDEKIVSCCTILIIPEKRPLFIKSQRQPFAVIENVITDELYRNKGYGTLILNSAKSIAQQNNCDKIVLFIKNEKEKILSFFKKAGYKFFEKRDYDFCKKMGYNSHNETAFIQWL